MAAHPPVVRPPSKLFALSVAVLLVLPLSACIADGSDYETGARSDELRIPGAWDPPAPTRATAATQYVPVVDPPAVSPGGSCSSTNPFACSCTHPACTPALPGTVELDRYLRGRFPSLTSGGLFCCRQNSARTSVPKLSVHAVGRAIDLMVRQEGGDADNGVGDPVANWLVENAEFVGVQRVIWDRAYWNGERGFGLLSSSSSPHTDHLHIELSADGAARRTPFFTSGASTGSCTARCEGTRIISADCSSGDCAAYGAICMPGPPPACGVPAPPEPDEAAVVPGAPVPGVSLFGTPARFTFTAPRRLFDTRRAESSADLVREDGTRAGPLAAMTTSDYQTSSLPPGASALWLNLAAISRGEPGFLSVYPSGRVRPQTSNVNFSDAGVNANAVPAVIGDGGGLSFYALSDADAVVDATGIFTPTGAGLEAVMPRRVFDSRAVDAPLLADTTRQIDVDAPEGATGVVTTITVIGGDAPGFVQAFPCGAEVPNTSNINFVPGAAIANTVLSELGDGLLCVRTSSTAHVIVDVTGYLAPDAPLSYQPLTPRRLLDTRGETTRYTGRLGRGQVIELPVQGLGGMADGVWAAVVNLTAVGANEPGFVTAFPCGGSVPATSSLNFGPSGAIGALSVTPLGPEGTLCLYARSRAHLIVDLLGVWVHDESLIPPPPPAMAAPGDEGEHEPLPGEEVDAGADGAVAADAGGGTIDRPAVEPSGCAVTRSRADAGAGFALGLVAAVWLARRRRRLNSDSRATGNS